MTEEAIDRKDLGEHLPGVDKLVVSLIRMRVLGDPDIFLSETAPERWRPWRSYAQQYLWQRPRAQSEDPRHA
ncbi:hypothetical protein [Actinomadura rudentiformis]|uniref:Uncharacterized protein n=1 Tax=Actinomadura rudentiformis TaxID=359158 RepID=A0A6H9YIH4_9ACTN|nr:hypothetical protein [Actinomadura rudentiformis]KAB2340852.1 hypothetical protein F8566_43850 [Actinomadura rudentiformis]